MTSGLRQSTGAAPGGPIGRRELPYRKTGVRTEPGPPLPPAAELVGVEAAPPAQIGGKALRSDPETRVDGLAIESGHAEVARMECHVDAPRLPDAQRGGRDPAGGARRIRVVEETRLGPPPDRVARGVIESCREQHP